MTHRDVAAMADLQIITHGDVPAEARADAERKIRALLRHAHGPILHARVRLDRLADPAVPKPVTVQVNLDVNGRLVRAQAAAPSAHEAIDMVQDRLRRQLDRVARTPRSRRRRLSHAAPAGQPAGEPGELATEPRMVIRHGTYAAGPARLEEAAADMDRLGYGFHLFTDAASGRDAVIYRAGPTGYRVAYVDGPPQAPAAPPAGVTVSPGPAARLHLSDAVHRLGATGRPFLFFAGTGSGRGRLLYRRHDGHYALVTPRDGQVV